MKEKRRRPSKDLRGAVSTGASEMVPPELFGFERTLKLRLSTFIKLDGKMELRDLGRFVSVEGSLTGAEGG